MGYALDKLIKNSDLSKKDKDITSKTMKILVEPIQIAIINTLKHSQQGLSVNEIKDKIVSDYNDLTVVQDYLNKLLEEKCVEEKNGIYRLTSVGDQIYKKMQEVIRNVK